MFKTMTADVCDDDELRSGLRYGQCRAGGHGQFALIGFQVIGLLLAIAIMWFYPITREKAAETQRRLRAKAL